MTTSFMLELPNMIMEPDESNNIGTRLVIKLIKRQKDRYIDRNAYEILFTVFISNELELNK